MNCSCRLHMQSNVTSKRCWNNIHTSPFDDNYNGVVNCSQQKYPWFPAMGNEDKFEAVRRFISVTSLRSDNNDHRHKCWWLFLLRVLKTQCRMDCRILRNFAQVRSKASMTVRYTARPIMEWMLTTGSWARCSEMNWQLDTAWRRFHPNWSWASTLVTKRLLSQDLGSGWMYCTLLQMIS